MHQEAGNRIVHSTTRREFVVAATIPLLGWIPWFRPRRLEIAEIRFRILRRGSDRRRYIWVHGNERTAAAVLREHLRHSHGRGFLIENSGRNVPYRGGELDPNRMWSRDGLEKNLRSLNPGWDFVRLQEVLDEFDRERQRFLDRMLPRRGELLVALHNNGPGYSVNDEVPISDRTAVPKPQRPREFMLCTDARDYADLSRTGFNVVLQQHAPKEDDGSMSRLAAARKVRYVNVEAPHGAAAEQTAMLAAVEALPEQRS